MITREIKVVRFSITSSRGFGDVVAAFEAVIGRPDLKSLGKSIAAAASFAELEKIVGQATGPSDLMEFMRLDLGAVLRVRTGTRSPRSLRFILGNPVVMSSMLEQVPDSGSYAPVTVLIDERADGVHLSYDTMAGFLAGYGSPAALKIAEDLDSKVEALLVAAAG